MIVLDKNVLSEILRPTPNDRPLSWLAAQPRSVLFTTTVTRAELLYGFSCCPTGNAKQHCLPQSDRFWLSIINGGQAAFIKLVFAKNELNGANADVPSRFYLRTQRFSH